jgi:hypothetical protein
MSATCGAWAYEWDFRAGPGSKIGSSLVLGGAIGGVCGAWAYEWDFRAGPGSKISGSLVAMEVASGGAGEGAA